MGYFDEGHKRSMLRSIQYIIAFTLVITRRFTFIGQFYLKSSIVPAEVTARSTRCRSTQPDRAGTWCSSGLFTAISDNYYNFG